MPLTRSIVPASLLLLLLASCGKAERFEHVESSGRLRSLAGCYDSKAVPSGYDMVAIKPVDGAGSCGIKRPIALARAPRSKVALTPTATLRCAMVPHVDAWLAETVQPAAKSIYGQRVAAIEVAASYSCRKRNGRRKGKLSEHSFGQALDVSAFTLADGRRITVKQGWTGKRKARKFLRATHRGACQRFSTVIGPSGDRYHRDHFHLDMAERATSRFRYCR